MVKKKENNLKHKPYLSYYTKNNIIPVVKLNNQNLKKLNFQRDSLFNVLKLDKKLLLNSSILEIGPGTGYNAFYLINNKIKCIDLVEGNISSIDYIKNTLIKVNKVKYKIFNCDFNNFNSNKKYDFVICENVLSGLNNPKFFLKKMSSYVKKNGYLIINCSDNVSLLSEKIRGLISMLILESNSNFKDTTFEDKTKILSNIFIKHMSSLKSFTRQIDDWVQDVLLYKFWWKKKKYFSILESIKVVEKQFNFYSSSPSFFEDYTWYKKIKNDHFNNLAKKEFLLNQHNFLDNRTFNFKISIKENIKLNKIIDSIASDILKLEPKKITNLIKNLNKLEKFYGTLGHESKLTCKSIKNVSDILTEYGSSKKININKLDNIKRWWGFGTQYVVFKKK